MRIITMNFAKENRKKYFYTKSWQQEIWQTKLKHKDNILVWNITKYTTIKKIRNTLAFLYIISNHKVSSIQYHATYFTLSNNKNQSNNIILVNEHKNKLEQTKQRDQQKHSLILHRLPGLITKQTVWKPLWTRRMDKDALKITYTYKCKTIVSILQ